MFVGHGEKMELIHPVESHERLISRGVYHYLRNGVEMPVTESWSAHQNPQGQYIVRAERDSRSFGGMLLVHAVVNIDHIEFFEVLWIEEKNGERHTIAANYEIREDGISVTRRCQRDGEQSEQLTDLALEGGFVVCPLMRIFVGMNIKAIIQHGGEYQVVTPWLRDTEDWDKLLTPQESRRQARLLSTESVEINGQSLQAEKYDYEGGDYESGTLFWLDEHTILLKYIWHQTETICWETRLVEYVRA